MGPAAGGARLLPRAHRLHGDGRPDLADVHHRPGRHQDRHRRGRRRSRSSAAPAPTTRTAATRTTSPATRTTRIDYVKTLLSLPAVRTTCEPTLPVVRDRRRRGRRSPTPTSSSTRSSRTRRTSPTTCHEVIQHVVDDGEFLEVQALFAPNIVVGLRPGRGPGGRHRREPADLSSPACLDIDASEKAARFVRTCDAFNVPIADLRRRAGLPARHRPGVTRHHPPRREADLRLRRGHRPARSRSSPARRTAARTTSWAPSTSAPTSTSPGRPPRSRSWAPQGAVNILYRRELKKAEDDGERRRGACGPSCSQRVRGHPRQPLRRGRARLRRRGGHRRRTRDPHVGLGRCARCATSARRCRRRSTGTSRCERAPTRVPTTTRRRVRCSGSSAATRRPRSWPP